MTEKDYYKPHTVYLIADKARRFYKIGLALNVEKRMRSFSLPFEVFLVSRLTLPHRGLALKTERGLHKLYRALRLRREWFRDIDEANFVFDAEYIAAGAYSLAEAEYKKRGGLSANPRKKKVSPLVKRSQDTRRRDQVVLQTLREQGIEAAMNLRKELK
jgi:hypothetical protein